MRMAHWAREPQRSELNELAIAWLELAEEGVTLVPADPILSPTTNKKRRVNSAWGARRSVTHDSAKIGRPQPAPYRPSLTDSLSGSMGPTLDSISSISA
jgi:hypothetical protein